MFIIACIQQPHIAVIVIKEIINRIQYARQVLLQIDLAAMLSVFMSFRLTIALKTQMFAEIILH